MTIKLSKNRLENWGLSGEILDGIEAKDFFAQNSDFSTEKDFCDYLELNMDNVCKDIFKSPLIKYERESYIDVKRGNFGLRGSQTRVDFFITCENGCYLIEAKKPGNLQREMNRSLAQILDYILVCEDCGVKLKGAWIFTTRIHESIVRLIARFKLPIHVCILNKQEHAVLYFARKKGKKLETWR